MTSSAKNNHQQITLMCEVSKWFGRDKSILESEMPEQMRCFKEREKVEKAWFHQTYANWQQNLKDPTYFQDRAILAPTHKEVGKVNSRMMFKLPAREKVYYNLDTVCWCFLFQGSHEDGC
ncbi:hypothetical protein CTI12_AA544770 [Artemisia annua]|uniref:Uncharacterized protein n=1 Tax=Artemisia annua TaxID=35608 RepID=A0A2U1L035_ARTAN|nr:hypothetical protein CTI12_AA544770 [Artemisia annua]